MWRVELHSLPGGSADTTDARATKQDPLELEVTPLRQWLQRLVVRQDVARADP
jgi:hypothetical protein